MTTPAPTPLPRVEVGGQAVIEGVMMRSPRSFVIVCRRPNGDLVVKEDAWQPIWKNLRFLRWPFLRGGIVLVESLWNGFAALDFAAEQQEEDALPARSLGAAAARKKSSLGSILLYAVSIAFGLALFVGVPHLLSWGLGHLVGFDTASGWFHLVDGVVKVIILVGYMAAISLIPDVRRVFMYHGAEHKAIFAYERGLELTVDNARRQPRLHPRCGTSFLLIVVLVSILLFMALLRGRIVDSAVLDNVVKIFIKVPLMVPVAALSYELLKLSGRLYERSALARAVVAPGLWLQHITTREPDDAQLEVALISIRKALWRERQTEAADGDVEVWKSAAEIPDLPLA